MTHYNYCNYSHINHFHNHYIITVVQGVLGKAIRYNYTCKLLLAKELALLH